MTIITTMINDTYTAVPQMLMCISTPGQSS